MFLNEGFPPVEVPPKSRREDARELVRRAHGLGNKVKHSKKEKLARKTRKDIKNRKIATCLGCGKPNWQCKCEDHKKPHFETQITYNWGDKK